MYKLQKGNIRVAIFAKYKGREQSIFGGGYIQKKEKDRKTMTDLLFVSDRNRETEIQRDSQRNRYRQIKRETDREAERFTVRLTEKKQRNRLSVCMSNVYVFLSLYPSFNFFLLVSERKRETGIQRNRQRVRQKLIF